MYRARDTKLGRDVAIKILPEELARDKERMERFEREARLLAQLNHSNIATLHGLEEFDGQQFLVMELVEGETLAERIARGPLAVDEALSLSVQIAEGLEAAHEKGIIHRDLKPANIKMTLDGQIKILDFGLARLAEADTDPSGEGGSRSPTLTKGTALGAILGTAAYMSPEQARGKRVDKRADIWAFGVVVYEMLTGRQLFAGETVSDVLASVLKADIDLGKLPEPTPAALRRLLRRCLERQPKERLRDIGEARIAIRDRMAGRSDDGATGPAANGTANLRPLWRRATPWVVGVSGLVVGVAGLAGLAPWGHGPVTEPRELPVSRFEIALPAEAPLAVENYPGRSLALSPDGTQIVYTASSRLHSRRLEEIEIHPLPSTESGRAPFFSPDGEWLAYFDWAEAALKKVSLRGGRPVTLARGFANAGWMLGGWCDDGRIVFDTNDDGLRVVDGDGADLRVLTEPTEEWHLDPEPLPGPCRVLFYTHGNEGQAIEAISVDSGVRTRILENASHGRFLPSGHLLFVRDGALHLAPFDAERLKIIGAAVALPIEALPDWQKGSAPNPQLALSRNGTLVYAPNDESAGGESTLVAVTLDGRVEELGPLPFPYPVLALSPDGERLALAGRRAGEARIVALDLRRRATTTLIGRGAFDGVMPPVWTPDGKAILYARFGPFEGEILRHELDGGAPDQVLRRVPGTWFSSWSISPDGRFLVISRVLPETGVDLVLLDLEADTNAPEAAKPLIATPAMDYGGAISPNGEWLAYNSLESGSGEILIEKFPERGQKTRVWSGSNSPVWSPDGRELYFMVPSAGGDGAHDVMAARVEAAPTLRVGEPRRLFSGFFASGSDMGPTVALTPDGRRFLMVRSRPGAPVSGAYTNHARRLIVVQNWFAELRRSRSEDAR